MKQFIKCPKCGAVQLGTIEKTFPFPTYIHDCEKCGYTIIESEWDTVPALSIRQPWASLICNGIKDIENRSWKLPEKHKGKRILIHAGLKDYDLTNNVLSEYQRGYINDLKRPLKYGAIIGSVEIVDCIKSTDNPNTAWGGLYCYHWILKNPIPLDTPIKCTGKLSFFIPEIL